MKRVAIVVLCAVAVAPGCKLLKDSAANGDASADAATAEVAAASTADTAASASASAVKPAVAAHAASAKPKAACKGYLIHGRCSATCANGDGDCPDPKERCEMWSGTDDTGLSAMNAPLCIYSASNEPRAKGAPSASSGAWTPPQSIVMPKYTESIRAPDGRVIPTDGKCTSGYGGPIAPYNRCHYLCSGDSDCEKGLRCKPFKNMKACQEP